MVKISILHVYIFRNIKQLSQGNKLVSQACFLKALRLVIYKAPSMVYSEIAKEMEEAGFLSRINQKYYEIKPGNDKELRRLKEYVFPCG